MIRVAIVDDHALVAQAFARLVDAEPDMRTVAIARDVSPALVIVDVHNPDVVLMDYDLPSGNGVDCAATMKSRNPTTKVLILTGGCSDDDLARAVEVGCDGFLLKTTGADEMISAIRRAHAGEAVFSGEDLGRVMRRVRARGSVTELSPREVDVLRCLARGASTAGTADELCISAHTVRSHVQHILEKMDAHSKLQAVSIALRQGIIEVEH